MWLSAVVRCGVLAGIATLACWSGNPAPRNSPIDNRRPLIASADESTPYWCSIADGYEYPPMPCVIRRVKGELVLEKLAGSQRFRGVVRPRDGGFTFDGQLYCPWGDCEQRLRGVFVPTGRGDGSLRGTFEAETMVVTLVPAPADVAWGGATYGGVGYGGFGYGGSGYGGTRRRR